MKENKFELDDDELGAIIGGDYYSETVDKLINAQKDEVLEKFDIQLNPENKQIKDDHSVNILSKEFVLKSKADDKVKKMEKIK